ncbi:hypothetical protein SELMODRAFT_181497 [Selaginella moellendorffii]|uniref:Formate dehydrogenase, mitochondrial n=1 Tax=Selaginella moellendorffii TaxID=88036 RepID=D8SPB4_SELML|nr:formate dehydrogenase, chloroplastic/mitochondrial [Selaginella moellendorffii]EFJ13636.1 hypothetical protein SELMODRAFT_181497 [Selaginella moellendorffii]|eukprot:XP_002985142.1 formate dehydrogenase, chloroplastic/mitochondrial [Selaginella moellendorffii]
MFRVGLQVASRSFSSAAPAKKLKVVGVFYKGGEHAAKNPKFIGNVENCLGIRQWLEDQGHDYIVTDDKEGPTCELEKHIPDMDVLITTPFHPGYMTAERIQKAKNLKLALTAGIGSDHIDLTAASKAGITVAEVTGSNVVSVAEDQLMRVLILLRNYQNGWTQVNAGGWDVAEIVSKAYDVQGKTIGSVGAGRIGYHLLKRLKAFDCNLLYYDRVAMPSDKEKETGATREADLDTMLAKCDAVVMNVPLTEKTRGFFNKDRISKMKRGAVLVNNARGALMDANAVAEACKSGHLGGYGGDVWYPQPPPKDHPWRSMPNNAMTPHVSGSTLDAQARYSAGVKEMLRRYFVNEEFPADYYIVKDGKIAPQYL